MKSMTGFGEGRSRGRNFLVNVELQSYNHRFLDVQVKLPPEYLKLEPDILAEISSRIERGRINAFVSFRLGPGRSSVRIDSELAKKYCASFRKLQRVLSLRGEILPEVLFKLPGVIGLDMVYPAAREFKKSLLLALRIALNRLLKMREKEGKALAADLKKHLRSLKKGRDRVRVQIETKNMGAPSSEAGSLSAGVNIREELSRLESHIRQFEDVLDKRQPVGKILEFITQEMLRETTTLADKAVDSYVSGQAVYMKMEIETLREQIRNVE